MFFRGGLLSSARSKASLFKQYLRKSGPVFSGIPENFGPKGGRRETRIRSAQIPSLYPLRGMAYLSYGIQFGIFLWTSKLRLREGSIINRNIPKPPTLRVVIGRFCKENKSAKTVVFCCRYDNAPHVDVLITKILLSGIGTQVNLSQITVGLK